VRNEQRVGRPVAEQLDAARDGRLLGVGASGHREEARGPDGRPPAPGAEGEACPEPGARARRARLQAQQGAARPWHHPCAPGVLSACIIARCADGKEPFSECHGKPEAASVGEVRRVDGRDAVPGVAFEHPAGDGAGAAGGVGVARDGRPCGQLPARERDGGTEPSVHARGRAQGAGELPSARDAARDVHVAVAGERGAGTGFADGHPVAVDCDGGTEPGARGGGGRQEPGHVNGHRAEVRALELVDVHRAGVPGGTVVPRRAHRDGQAVGGHGGPELRRRLRFGAGDLVDRPRSVVGEVDEVRLPRTAARAPAAREGAARHHRALGGRERGGEPRAAVAHGMRLRCGRVGREPESRADGVQQQGGRAIADVGIAARARDDRSAACRDGWPNGAGDGAFRVDGADPPPGGRRGVGVRGRGRGQRGGGEQGGGA